MELNKALIHNCHGVEGKKKYLDLRLRMQSPDNRGLAVSDQLLACVWEGAGGSVAILNQKEIDVRKPKILLIGAHRKPLTDLCFSPFYNSLLATASEDTCIKIWDIPINSYDKIEPIATLDGHSRKITCIDFNTIAESILGSISVDGVVAVWNINASKVVSQFQGTHGNSVSWNYEGSLLAALGKTDFKLIDPRNPESQYTPIKAHEGSKPGRVTWLGGKFNSSSYLLSVGYGHNGEREAALWDSKNLTEPIDRFQIDRSIGDISIMNYDLLGITYICGKGDTSIKPLSIKDNTKIEVLKEFKASTQTKFSCIAPERTVDLSSAEVTRIFRADNNSKVEIISFFLPKRNMDDMMLPEVAAGHASVTTDQWLEGMNNSPITQPTSKKFIETTISTRENSSERRRSSEKVDETEKTLMQLLAELEELKKFTKEDLQILKNRMKNFRSLLKQIDKTLIDVEELLV